MKQYKRGSVTKLVQLVAIIILLMRVKIISSTSKIFSFGWNLRTRDLRFDDKRCSRWTTSEYFYTTLCWSCEIEEAKLVERWLSIQGCKVPLPFQGKKGKENVSSQYLSTKHYNNKVTRAILPAKAQITFNKRVHVPEMDTGG